MRTEQRDAMRRANALMLAHTNIVAARKLLLANDYGTEGTKPTVLVLEQTADGIRRELLAVYGFDVGGVDHIEGEDGER